MTEIVYRCVFLTGTGRKVFIDIPKEGRSRELCIQEAQDTFQEYRGTWPGEPLRVEELERNH